jgi:hypothetical protein
MRSEMQINYLTGVKSNPTIPQPRENQRRLNNILVFFGIFITFPSSPAYPMTLHPLSLAIWPTRLPTAPAAPDTTTVSPSLGNNLVKIF